MVLCVARVPLICIINILTLLINPSFSQLISWYKSVTLTPSNSDIGAVRLINHFSEVSNVNNTWYVAIQSQNTWQFILTLDHTWAFDPDLKSTVKITIDSPSIASGAKATYDDIVFGFTTDNTDYFSMWIPMDNTGQKNRIYPLCNTDQTPTQTFGIGDIASLPNLDRNCDVAGGSCSNWNTIFPKNAQDPLIFQTNNFPITLLLENDPILNTLFISFDTATFSSSFIQQCGFISFPTNNGLKVYIGGNDPGHTFVIKSFKIESWITIDIPKTSNPTHNPTHNPSTSPTKTPTITPSIHPTLTPTLTPTKTPTITPSINPTLTPTLTPTKTPTITPSINPTLTPTTSPTKTPTIKPSINPTLTPTLTPTIDTLTPTLPTFIPTLTPTVNPILTPTFIPTYNPSISPTNAPSTAPSNDPSISPSNTPTNTPTSLPSISPTSTAPTRIPTSSPTPMITLDPTRPPSGYPTVNPTTSIPTTSIPSIPPTNTPSSNPSIHPSFNPTFKPTTAIPSINPTQTPTNNPSLQPTINPTIQPTLHPTNTPSVTPTTTTPTRTPITFIPTSEPTLYPTLEPTIEPTSYPSITPSKSPTDDPTKSTLDPTKRPTSNPTRKRKTPPIPRPLITFYPTTEAPTAQPTYIAYIPSTTASINTPHNTSLDNTSKNNNVAQSTDESVEFIDKSDDRKPTMFASTKFGDIILPLTLIVFVGACALCCVVVVIIRQICVRNLGSRTPHKYINPVHLTPPNGHDDMDECQRPASPLSLSDSISAQHIRHVHHVHPRRPPMISNHANDDGQYLTVPLKKNTFCRNLSTCGHDDDILMDGIIEEMDDSCKRRKSSRPIANRYHRTSNPMDHSLSHSHHTPVISSSDSDDTFMERPDRHNYSTMTLKSGRAIADELHRDIELTQGLSPKHRRNPYHDLTPSGFGRLQLAINEAKTHSDFDKLESLIKKGKIPSTNWHGKGDEYGVKLNKYRFGARNRTDTICEDEEYIPQAKQSSESTDASSESSDPLAISNDIDVIKVSKVPNMANSIATTSVGVRLENKVVLLDENELTNKLVVIKNDRKKKTKKRRNAQMNFDDISVAVSVSVGVNEEEYVD